MWSCLMTAALALSGSGARPTPVALRSALRRPVARPSTACVCMAADAELDALLAAPPIACKGRVRKLVDKPKGILSLIGGFNRRWDAISFAKGEVNARALDEVGYISRQFRLGGAAGAFVEVSMADDVADVRAMVVEQALAKAEFPGPLAVFYAGQLVKPYDVAEAARSGCGGVMLDLPAVGQAKASELYACASKLGLEVVVYAEPSAASIRAAAGLSANTGLVCVRAPNTSDALEALPHFPAGVVAMAACPVGLVRDVWVLRDAGFSVVVLGDSLLDQSTVERVEVQQILKSMKAKGSSKFGRGTSMGRGEGAKEVLGTMSI